MPGVFAAGYSPRAPAGVFVVSGTKPTDKTLAIRCQVVLRSFPQFHFAQASAAMELPLLDHLSGGVAWRITSKDDCLKSVTAACCAHAGSGGIPITAPAIPSLPTTSTRGRSTVSM